MDSMKNMKLLDRFEKAYPEYSKNTVNDLNFYTRDKLHILMTNIHMDDILQTVLYIENKGAIPHVVFAP